MAYSKKPASPVRQRQAFVEYRDRQKAANVKQLSVFLGADVMEDLTRLQELTGYGRKDLLIRLIRGAD